MNNYLHESKFNKEYFRRLIYYILRINMMHLHLQAWSFVSGKYIKLKNHVFYLHTVQFLNELLFLPSRRYLTRATT